MKRDILLSHYFSQLSALPVPIFLIMRDKMTVLLISSSCCIVWRLGSFRNRFEDLDGIAPLMNAVVYGCSCWFVGKGHYTVEKCKHLRLKGKNINRDDCMIIFTVSKKWVKIAESIYQLCEVMKSIPDLYKNALFFFMKFLVWNNRFRFFTTLFRPNSKSK